MAQIHCADGNSKLLGEEDAIRVNKTPKQRLTEVKDVLKNSKTLKE